MEAFSVAVAQELAVILTSPSFCTTVPSAGLYARDSETFLDLTGRPCTHASRSPRSCRSGTRPPAGAARALECF